MPEVRSMADENGAAAAAPEPDAPEATVPASERIMGLFGLAVAIAIGAIAIDLATGGALARFAAGLIPTAAPSDDDG
jgi:hypothetical protein